MREKDSFFCSTCHNSFARLPLNWSLSEMLMLRESGSLRLATPLPSHLPGLLVGLTTDGSQCHWVYPQGTGVLCRSDWSWQPIRLVQIAWPLDHILLQIGIQWLLWARTGALKWNKDQGMTWGKNADRKVNSAPPPGSPRDWNINLAWGYKEKARLLVVNKWCFILFFKMWVGGVTLV